MDDHVIVRGGCHCGSVRFSADVPAGARLLDCNCSICRKAGFLHLIVPQELFRLESGAEVLTEYRFNTGTARHLFCRLCGVKSFYHPRSHPHGISVNANCLDERIDLPVDGFDGADWEAARARLG